MSDVRCQRSEVRGQMSEVRGQMSEDRKGYWASGVSPASILISHSSGGVYPRLVRTLSKRESGKWNEHHAQSSALIAFFKTEQSEPILRYSMLTIRRRRIRYSAVLRFAFSFVKFHIGAASGRPVNFYLNPAGV